MLLLSAEMPDLAASAGVRLEQADNELPSIGSKEVPSGHPPGIYLCIARTCIQGGDTMPHQAVHSLGCGHISLEASSDHYKVRSSACHTRLT